MFFFRLPEATDSSEIIFADDGETVTVYIEGKTCAAVTLSGEIACDNIRAETEAHPDED